MAQDTTRGARSLMEAVAEVAPDLDARRVPKEQPTKGQPAGAPAPVQKGGPPPLPAVAPAVGLSQQPASKSAPPPLPAATLAAMPKPVEPVKVELVKVAAPLVAAPVAPKAPAPAVAIAPPAKAAPSATPVAATKISSPKVIVAPTADVLPSKTEAPSKPASDTVDPEPDTKPGKRRPAGPARGAGVAANDDLPTIGGLVYALHQKPTRQIYVVAAGLSGLWLVVGAILSYLMIAPEWARAAGVGELFGKPVILISLATIVLPLAVFWVIAWMVYQAQDLRLRSSAMTEVAIRLAEPDREAEQAVASLGQTVRRQVNYMNDAISQAIGRAGELEALVHNEVASLEQSFTANEARIRSLLDAFALQRTELTGTSDHVHQTLRAISQEVPQLLENLQGQQAKIARLVEGAGQNLLALDSSLTKASGQLETTLGERTTALQSVLTDASSHVQTLLTDSTGQMQNVLADSATQMQSLFVDRTTHLQTVLDEYTSALHTTLGTRTSEFQTVFEQFTSAIDQTLAARSEAIGTQFAARLETFDESIRVSTQSIDSTVGEKARLLAAAMDSHAKQLADTLGRQSQNLDETLLQGINAVRRTSENITRQSVKAIEGLAGQADMLKSVSENIFSQIGTVTNRFENQSQSILRAANSLESANHRIDQTLQNRHRELTDTLGRVTESTDLLGQQMTTYKSTIESSFSDAAQQTRALTDDLARGAQSHAKSALSDLQRLRTDTEQQTTRAFDSLRDQFATVSREVSDQVGSLSSRLAETTDEIRARTRSASEDLAREQEALRQQAQQLPDATRQSADAMRRVLSEQLKALDEVSRIATREQRQMDIAPPVTQPAPPPPRAALPPGQSVSLTAAVAEQTRAASAPVSGWSFGDLLARASRPDTPNVVPEPAPQSQVSSAPINLDQIAAALDAPTAGAIWARFRSGQRGILVRSIYSADGRAVFDDLSRRYQIDLPFRAMVDRFLADFEREVREVEGRDRTGQMLQTHLVSSSGRVYLFLAHASGRLT